MISVWTFLRSGVGKVLVILLAIVTFGATQRRKGRKENQRKQEEIDNETANDIRDRVDAVERVPDDELKYRND